MYKGKSTLLSLLQVLCVSYCAAGGCVDVCLRASLRGSVDKERSPACNQSLCRSAKRGWQVYLKFRFRFARAGRKSAVNPQNPWLTGLETSCALFARHICTCSTLEHTCKLRGRYTPHRHDPAFVNATHGIPFNFEIVWKIDSIFDFSIVFRNERRSDARRVSVEACQYFSV